MLMAAYEFLYQEDIYSITDSILVVIDKPWEEMGEEERILLSKILGSVKLSLDKVQVVHATNSSIDSLKTYPSSKIISFGVSLSSESKYEIHQQDGITYIQSDKLNELSDQTKKSLWVALREVFLS